MYLKYEIQTFGKCQNTTYLKIEKTVKTKQSYWETLANIICDF